jgi:hypothetical protein
MAFSEDNDLVFGARGRVGKMLIFKKFAGKTLMVRSYKPSQPLTPEQIEANQRFTEASAYAMLALKTPAIKQEYKRKTKPGQSAYNLAVGDFFNAPAVREIITMTYTGLPGSKVNIWAEDDFKVTSVHVSIASENGALIEEGEALFDTVSKLWIYTAIQTNSNLPGTIITAVAKDMPGNEAMKEAVLM